MKKRSYVKELKDEDILALLKTLGYELTFIINRKTGDILPPVEKYEDEKGCGKLFVRCKEIENRMEKPLEILKGTQMAAIYNHLKNGIAGDFLDGKGFLYISDFDIIDSFMNNMFNFNKKETPYEETTQYKYAHFMAEKFGDEYIKDYNNSVDEHNAKVKEDKLQEDTEDEQIEL